MHGQTDSGVCALLIDFINGPMRATICAVLNGVWFICCLPFCHTDEFINSSSTFLSFLVHVQCMVTIIKFQYELNTTRRSSNQGAALRSAFVSEARIPRCRYEEPHSRAGNGGRHGHDSCVGCWWLSIACSGHFLEPIRRVIRGLFYSEMHIFFSEKNI